MKANDFDRVASNYDWLAKLVFGDTLKRAQTRFLPELPESGHLLIIGGGTGWIIQEIQKIRPSLRIDYIEASQRMLELSKRYENQQTSFILGDEHDIPDRSYDAIITNFFLDVFEAERLTCIMSKLKERLKQDGIWLCTDFQKTKSLWHKVLVKSMHLFFRAATRLESGKLKEFDAYFVKEGLASTKAQNFYSNLIFTRIYRFTSQ